MGYYENNEKKKDKIGVGHRSALLPTITWYLSIASNVLFFSFQSLESPSFSPQISKSMSSSQSFKCKDLQCQHSSYSRTIDRILRASNDYYIGGCTCAMEIKQIRNDKRLEANLELSLRPTTHFRIADWRIPSYVKTPDLQIRTFS